MMYNMKDDYRDIIEHPLHEPDPDRHPRMERSARAAQFASFAALTGFEEVIERTGEEVFNSVINETLFEDIEDI